MTPKGHCEMAGQGIEYCWGKSKKYYRRNHKTNKRNFKPLVLESMSRKVLTLRSVRKFARLARAYVSTYAGVGGATCEYVDIERMRRTFATHRNALDFAGKVLDEA